MSKSMKNAFCNVIGRIIFFVVVYIVFQDCMLMNHTNPPIPPPSFREGRWDRKYDFLIFTLNAYEVAVLDN